MQVFEFDAVFARLPIMHLYPEKGYHILPKTYTEFFSVRSYCVALNLSTF